MATCSHRAATSDGRRPPETLDSRLIAGLRLALSLMTLLVFAIDPWRVFPFFSVIAGVIGVYLAYASVAYGAALRRGGAAAALALNYPVDAGAFVLLISLTGTDGSSTSYFSFFLFLFAVMTASFGRGAGAGQRLTMITAGLVSGALLGRASLTENVEATRALLQLGYILGLGAIAARLGGRELTLRRRLALLRDAGVLSNPRFGAERTIGTLLARLRGFYDADVCLLVTNTAEDHGWRLHRCERNPRDNAVSEAPLPVELADALLWLPRDALAVYDRRPPHWWSLVSTGCLSERWRKDGNFGDHQVTGPPAAVESLLNRFGGQSWLSVPAYSRLHWLGRLHIIGGRAFNPSDAEFALQVLEAGMLVVENIRLVDQLASTAAHRERQRLACDIHDSVIQPYIGLQFGLSAVQRALKSGNWVAAQDEVRRLLGLTGVAIDDLRACVGGLKSEPAAGGNSLLPALRDHAARFAQDTGIAVEVTGGDAVQRGDRLDAELFQMAVEALSNVRRHTAATHAAIRFLPDEGHITLRVENEESPDVGPHAFTPVSITERAAALGGHVTVDRRRDGRTIVEITVPL